MRGGFVQVALGEVLRGDVFAEQLLGKFSEDVVEHIVYGVDASGQVVGVVVSYVLLFSAGDGVVMLSDSHGLLQNKHSIMKVLDVGGKVL